jgi:hypothetical protein
VGRLLPGILEPVHYSRWYDYRISRSGEDCLESLPELHGPLHHLEAFLLLWVDVSSGDVAIWSEEELEGEQFAVCVRGGLAEDDPLAADRVLQYLSCVRHG